MDWKYLYTSFEGRISRRPYWISFLVLMVALFIIYIVLAFLAGALGIVLIIAISIASIYPSLAIVVKRLHDRNKSGWWALALYIPSMVNGGVSSFNPVSGLAIVTGIITFVISLWFLIELGFLKGTPGSNEYGPEPLQG